jgi:hypothetical protein
MDSSEFPFLSQKYEDQIPPVIPEIKMLRLKVLGN